MTLYGMLVFVHVFSAILGMGPGFILTFIVSKANTMSELKHAYAIRHRIHIIVMIGGTLLLITGVWMGILRPYLFTEVWYVMSVVLFLVALAIGPLVLSPRSRPIKQLLKEHIGEEIPNQYYTLSKKLFFYEHIENLIFIVIIILMLTKPF
ncbi:MAG TPA: DUF2269 domain-containing protein [Candidatus Paenibacillus intestinavium]|nr:DUF2269 domain-containing protein [Candidatus Paenibacillus intestinavium]